MKTFGKLAWWASVVVAGCVVLANLPVAVTAVALLVGVCGAAGVGCATLVDLWAGEDD